MNTDVKLIRGDCLEVMKGMPDGSVDLVLTDPPYGIMRGIDNKHEWDVEISPAEIFAHCSRILRQNGKLILFSQEPYTSRLITEQAASLPFSYRAIWLKNTAGNILGCSKAMVSRYEDVCIFQKIHDAEGKHPLREYFKRVLDYTGLDGCKSVNNALGHRRAEHCFYVTGEGNGSTQFSLCTEQTYAELVMMFGIHEMDDFIPYDDLKRINEKYESRFNLWQGGKSKSNVLEYAKDGGSFHPTQKPVALLEDLIKTFSNAGDTVLDFTMGSGSTGVACVQTGRHFIGIELDENYFEIAKRRIEEAQDNAPRLLEGVLPC